MSTESYSLKHVDEMIDFLDKQIEAGRDTPAMLTGLQQRLDIIDFTYRNDPRFAQFYSHMLELQALIYGRRQQDDKAVQFMKEAVREAGGVRGLQSKTIREYIGSHSSVGHHKHRRSRVGKFGSLLRFKSRNVKVAFAVVFGLLMVSVATFHFVPQVAAFSSILVNHSQIDNAKKTFETLTSELDQCSAQLNQERGAINTSDQSAVDAYNTATRQCQALQQEQNQAASRYNSLIGKH
jgi:hypothetical protein